MKSFAWKLVVQTIVLFALIAASLFISAGTVEWAEGWIFFGLFLLFFLGVSIWLSIRNPGLAQRANAFGRSKPGRMG